MDKTAKSSCQGYRGVIGKEKWPLSAADQEDDENFNKNNQLMS